MKKVVFTLLSAVMAIGLSCAPVFGARMDPRGGSVAVSNYAGPAGAKWTAPAGGWTVGTNTFAVECPEACSAARVRDGGTTVLSCVERDGVHVFTADLEDGDGIAIVLVGDVNLDGKLTLADLARMGQHRAGKYDLSEYGKLAADMDQDGELTLADLTCMGQYRAGRFMPGWLLGEPDPEPVPEGFVLTVGSCEHGTPTSSEVRTDADGIVIELPGVENCDMGCKFSRWTAVVNGETVTVDIGTRLTGDTVINAAFADGTSIDTAKMNSLLKAQARTIRFDKGDPANGVDISAKRDRSVLATLDTKTNEGVIYLNDSYLNGSLSCLFQGYTALASADLSGLDTSDVTAMCNVFDGCSALTSVDLSGLDTSKVTDMGFMFAGCSSLTSLDLSGFDTSAVTSMWNMFGGCGSLTSVDLSGFDTSVVRYMWGMFHGCKALTSVDLSGFDTGMVSNMGFMFDGCSSLVSLDLSGFDTGRVVDMGYMFRDCGSLVSLDLSGFDTGAATKMGSMFDHCGSLVSLDLSGFDTSAVTDMNGMFSGCGSLVSLDLSGFDTGAVSDMGQMFSGCSSLVSLDLSGFDTGAATKMYNMFSSCGALESLDLSGFDTVAVTHMGQMFSNCGSLVSLDLSGFDTGTVEDMNCMFLGCGSLVSLDLSGFDTGSVTEVDWMFRNCGSLRSLYVKDEASKVKIYGSSWFPASTCTIVVGAPERAGGQA